MWKDPIVEEIREQADKTASLCGYDVRKFYEYLKEKEHSSKEKLVSFQPKKYSPIHKKVS